MLLLVRVGAGGDHREMLGGLRCTGRERGSYTAVLDDGVHAFCLPWSSRSGFGARMSGCACCIPGCLEWNGCVMLRYTHDVEVRGQI